MPVRRQRPFRPTPALSPKDKRFLLLGRKVAKDEISNEISNLRRDGWIGIARWPRVTRTHAARASSLTERHSASKILPIERNERQGVEERRRKDKIGKA